MLLSLIESLIVLLNKGPTIMCLATLGWGGEVGRILPWPACLVSAARDPRTCHGWLHIQGKSCRVSIQELGRGERGWREGDRDRDRSVGGSHGSVEGRSISTHGSQ